MCNWIVLIYGLLIFLLGYLGYHKGGSQASLYSGVGFGSLLILSALFMFGKKRFGFYAALILTAALVVTFGIRYAVSHKSLPATLAILSAAVFLILLTRIPKWKK